MQGQGSRGFCRFECLFLLYGGSRCSRSSSTRRYSSSHSRGRHSARYSRYHPRGRGLTFPLSTYRRRTAFAAVAGPAWGPVGPDFIVGLHKISLSMNFQAQMYKRDVLKSRTRFLHGSDQFRTRHIFDGTVICKAGADVRARERPGGIRGRTAEAGRRPVNRVTTPEAELS